MNSQRQPQLMQPTDRRPLCRDLLQQLLLCLPTEMS